MRITVSRAKSVSGSLRAPSDKSLTHRAFMFGAIANGSSRVRSPLKGEDCMSTLACLQAIGLEAAWESQSEVVLSPPVEWLQPTEDLDCGNSGTTMRLLSGLVASRPLDVRLVGDASLSRRPMGRIAKPLRLMGVGVDGETPPLTIRGRERLRGIRYESPVASAQIKSCVLLAGLRADADTTVVEPSLSRDHTERMLRAMGASVTSSGREVTVTPAAKLNGFEIAVPADISSAAFFMVAAALVPGGGLLLEDLSVNPTRTGILDVFSAAGVLVEVRGVRYELGEPVADVRVSSLDDLEAFEICGDLVPRLIDEIPVLAVMATQCSGTTVIRHAAELRVKETDRLETVAQGLRAMGGEVETFADGMAITGPCSLRGAAIDAEGDHRIGMAFAIAGLVADGETTIDNAESIATSFPGFEGELRRVTGGG